MTDRLLTIVGMLTIVLVFGAFVAAVESDTYIERAITEHAR